MGCGASKSGQKRQLFSPIVPHQVNANTNYRLWSLASRSNDGLLQCDTSNNIVNCNGSFSELSNTVITTSEISMAQNHVSLLFKDLEPNTEFVVTAVTAQNGGIDIKALAKTSSGEGYPENATVATFVPQYYWSYTVFQTKWYNQIKYLGCDSNGNTTLVDMPSLQYPNPQALFILNKTETLRAAGDIKTTSTRQTNRSTNKQTDPIGINPHPVNPTTEYRLWNLVSRKNDGLLQLDMSNNVVNCSGSFSELSNTVITTSEISIAENDVSLLFKDLEKNVEYVVTAQNGGIGIEALETSSGSRYSEQAKFIPEYYWSYTMFQSKLDNTKYLGCDSDGNTTLVDMLSLQYPNPQALFILNEVHADQ